MPPRPTPDDSLFAEEKPYLQGRRRSSLTLSGLDHNDHLDLEQWDDELGAIELTHSGDGTKDPLWRIPQTDACQNDEEIAALMAAQWNREGEKKRQLYADYRTKPVKLTGRQKCMGCLWLSLVILGLVGLGMYAVLFGFSGGSHHRGAFQCPTAEHPLDLPLLEQLLQEQRAGNNTSVCRKDRPLEECTCQNPTGIPLPKETKSMEEQLQKETALLEGRDYLDVVFVGPFLDILDEDEDLWTLHNLRKAQIANEEELRFSSLLYRFVQPDVMSSQVHPKAWWISVGLHDLVQDGCSLDAVHSGINKLVEHILERDPDAKIVLSPPTGDAALWADWNDRLKCVAEAGQVEFYDPYHPAVEEEDDDFFLDVSTASSTSSSLVEATPEEFQQAVVDKLVELLP